MFQFDFNLWLQAACVTLCAVFICYFLILSFYLYLTFDSKFMSKDDVMFSFVKTFVINNNFFVNNFKWLQLKQLLVEFNHK